MTTGRPVVVGRIVGSYGVRGWLRIEPFNHPNESVLLTARRWLLQRPATAGAIRQDAATASAAAPADRPATPRSAVAPAAATPRSAAAPSAAPPGSAAARASHPGLPVLPAEFEVLRCKVQGDILLAAVEGVGVKEVADALRGCEVAVDRSEFPPAGDDEFYWIDLIGCLVVTPDGAELGLVEGIDDHGAHPLLRVRDAQGRERLIPFVSAHVPEVDVPARRIVADWDPDF